MDSGERLSMMVALGAVILVSAFTVAFALLH
jgi:hypothetical protein